MQIKNIHSNKEKTVSFVTWYYGLTNKKDFIIVDWDLVFWQTIKDGKIVDHKITERAHAQKIIESNDSIYTLRELTDSEWLSLKNEFYDSPEVLSNAEKKQISKSKELIKNCYKENLSFNDYYMNHLKRRITRDATKNYLIELYKDDEINSLPYDLESSSVLNNDDSNLVEINQRNKQATHPTKTPNKKSAVSFAKKPPTMLWQIIAVVVAIGLTIIVILVNKGII